MSNRHLEYIIAIYEEGQISKAATKLYISQPAISRTLKNIELELGGCLFIRKNGKCIPTELGELYVEYAKKAIHEERLLYQKIKELGSSVTISYGITPSRSKTLSPFVLKKFNEKFPHIEVNIIEGTVEYLENEFQKGNIDIIFVTTDEKPKKGNASVLGVEEIVLTIQKNKLSASILPQVKPPHRFPWINLQQLDAGTFITLKKTMRLGQITPRLFKDNNIDKPKKIVVDSIDTAQELAINGMGVCFCSDLNVNYYSDKLDIFSFGVEPTYWYFVAFYRDLTDPLEYLVKLHAMAIEKLR